MKPGQRAEGKEEMMVCPEENKIRRGCSGKIREMRKVTGWKSPASCGSESEVEAAFLRADSGGHGGSLRGPGNPQGLVEAPCSGVRRRISMCGPARLWRSGLLVTVSQYLG